MHGNHFTLTISQSNSDLGDFAVHIKEPNKREKLLVHIRFVQCGMFNEAYLDSLLAYLTKMLAKRIIEWQVAPEDNGASVADQQEAREIVDKFIEKIRKSSHLGG